MTAKAKKFIAAGYLGQHQCTLTETERARLAVHGLTDGDLQWLERQATLFNMANHRTDVAPTPAQVLAALADGEKAVMALLTWLRDIDDVARAHIRNAATITGIEFSFKDATANLDALDTIIELARRDSDEPQAGRAARTAKHQLAVQMVRRFGEELAYEALRAVLPDSKQNLKNLINSACKELAEK
jgi:hypothetical protein